MAGITLVQAEAQLALWIAASAAVAGNQEYEMNTGSGSRRLRRADASEIRAQIDYWDRKVKQLTGGNAQRRVRYVVPE